MKTKPAFLFLLLFAAFSCDIESQSRKCNDTEVKYKLEDMDGYEVMQVVQSYYEKDENRLTIFIQNFDTNTGDELQEGDVSIELHLLNCLKREGDCDSTFQKGAYVLRSNDAVASGKGVMAFFRTHNGLERFYEISNVEDKGPKQAEGSVQIESIHGGMICGRVDLIDTHGKSIKGTFSAKETVQASGE